MNPSNNNDMTNLRNPIFSTTNSQKAIHFPVGHSSLERNFSKTVATKCYSQDKSRRNPTIAMLRTDPYWLNEMRNRLFDAEVDIEMREQHRATSRTTQQTWKALLQRNKNRYTKLFKSCRDLNESPWNRKYAHTTSLAVVFARYDDKMNWLSTLRNATALQLGFEDALFVECKKIATDKGEVYKGNGNSDYNMQPPFLPNHNEEEWRHAPSIVRNLIETYVNIHESKIYEVMHKKDYFPANPESPFILAGSITELLDSCSDQIANIYCPRQELMRMRIGMFVYDKLQICPIPGSKLNFLGLVHLKPEYKSLIEPAAPPFHRDATTFADKNYQTDMKWWRECRSIRFDRRDVVYYMKETGEGMWTFAGAKATADLERDRLVKSHALQMASDISLKIHRRKTPQTFETMSSIPRKRDMKAEYQLSRKRSKRIPDRMSIASDIAIIPEDEPPARDKDHPPLPHNIQVSPTRIEKTFSQIEPYDENHEVYDIFEDILNHGKTKQQSSCLPLQSSRKEFRFAPEKEILTSSREPPQLSPIMTNRLIDFSEQPDLESPPTTQFDMMHIDDVFGPETIDHQETSLVTENSPMLVKHSSNVDQEASQDKPGITNIDPHITRPVIPVRNSLFTSPDPIDMSISSTIAPIDIMSGLQENDSKEGSISPLRPDEVSPFRPFQHPDSTYHNPPFANIYQGKVPEHDNIETPKTFNMVIDEAQYLPLSTPEYLASYADYEMSGKPSIGLFHGIHGQSRANQPVDSLVEIVQIENEYDHDATISDVSSLGSLIRQHNDDEDGNGERRKLTRVAPPVKVLLGKKVDDDATFYPLTKEAVVRMMRAKEQGSKKEMS